MSDRLHDFARAVVARQQEQGDTPDEEVMKAVALELGMTEEDLLAARAESAARKKSAHTMRQQGAYDEAIAELEQAHAFAPTDLEATTMLADTLIRRGRKKDDAADLERARGLCLAVLRAAPANTEAATLLNVIKMNPAGEHKRVPGGIVVAVLVAIIVAVAALITFVVGGPAR
jgi:tetratricopeptide (TPR) repeat protein